MGAKSRVNYPVGMFISQEQWDLWFPKEKTNANTQSEIKSTDSSSNNSGIIQS
jgi:hypothetical protein